MPNLLDSITGKTSHDSRPAFSDAACINRKQRKYTCTLCHDICPGRIFSLKAKETIKWDMCLACGLCVSVCPTRCFSLSSEMQEKLTSDIDLSRDITFSCYYEEQLCDKTVDCLASVPWELFALLAMNTRVVICASKCSECRHIDRSELLENNMLRLLDFLGDELFTQRVHIVTDGKYEGETPEKSEESEFARREIFSGMKKGLKKNLYKTAAKRLSFLDGENADGMKYRRVLANTTIKQRNEAITRKKEDPDHNAAPQNYGLQLPAFSSKCYGCGICSKICPVNAIEIGALENEGRIIYIDTAKCTGCGLCEKLCPSVGIAGITKTMVPYMGKLPLVKVRSAACETCGAVIKPDAPENLCAVCISKRRKTK